MKTIGSRVDDKTHANIQTVCEKMGVSLSDFNNEALFYFMTEHNHKISLGMKLKHAERETRREQKQMFFFKNAKIRLIRQVEWQYKEYGYVNHDQVAYIVNKELEKFEFIDENIQKMLVKQKQEFSELLKPIQYEMYVITKLPEQLRSGIAWTNTKGNGLANR